MKLNKQILILVSLTVLALLQAACARDSSPAIEQNAPLVEATAVPSEIAATPAVVEPTAVETAVFPETPTTEPLKPAAEETAAVVLPTETAMPPAAPVTVTFFTPSQQEGPYYPVEKLDDRDHDLVTLQGAAGVPAGLILEFGGTVYDAGGYPVEGAVVEIWQTDAAGVYLHPGDPGTENRDRNFQFYGEAVSDANGRYELRTILPGLYEPRPRHIHSKVRVDGREVLTTQFYFAGEIELQGADALMLIDAQPGTDAAGNAILSGERDIFLDI